MRRLGFLAVAVAVLGCNGSSAIDGGSDASVDAAANDLAGDALAAGDLGGDGPRIDAPACADADGDGHDAVSCGGDDCDDTDANRYPTNTEICDSAGRDEDCNPATLGPDADHDGFPYWGCCNGQPDGSLVCGTDCDDGIATVNPTAAETCDGIDDDCNGMIDEGVAAHYCFDGDGDGHGSLAGASSGCGTPAGATTSCNDCNDFDPSVYVGATEQCNGSDDDCNGAVDEGCACAPDGVTQPCGFTLGACASGIQTCIAGAWEATCAGATLPLLETCNGVDDDCDGAIDEGLLFTFYPDCDGDGYGADARATSRCAAPTGVPPGCPHGVWGTVGGDCDDTDAARTPVAGCGPVVDAGVDAGAVDAGGSGMLTFSTLALGDGLLCGVTTSGTVACAGDARSGEHGDGTTSPTPGPYGIASGIADAVEVVAGGGSFGTGHVCARRAGGAVACWGAGTHGELGYGGFSQRVLPVAVYGIDDATQLAAGYEHTCALRHDHSVWCWGAGSSGQLGDGATTDLAVPDVVSGITDAIAIAAGEYHTCALRMGGTVQCWGNDYRGQLGDGTRTNHAAPVDVAGLTGVSEIAAGRYHTCALLTGGAIDCWGANDRGQLGRGTTSVDGLVPTAVTGLAGAASHVALGASHTCAIIGATGAATCWGADGNSELGDGGAGADESVPVVLAYPFAPGGRIYAGGANGCVLTPTDGAMCWGDTNAGIFYPLGGGDPASAPTLVFMLP